MKLSRIVSTIIIITMTAGLASASPADLTIFPEESSTEINSFTSYEVEVENSGTVKDVYEMQHNYPGEISVAPNKVELEPGQEETVNVWFNPRQDRDEGRYQFSLTADSQADGQEYSVSGFVNVIKNYKVDVDVDQANSVCKGETARYNVEVTNDGIQSDQIALSTEFGELSENRVTLDAGESTEVTVTASSEEALDRNFNIKASSTSVSYATDTESAAFTSETCYQSSMSVSPETSETSAFNEAEFDITVQNNGTKTDEFSLSADRGELSTSNLEVEPGSTETATLTFTPEELGDHQIDIEASGRSTTTNTVTVEASNGMESEVSFDEAKTVCRDESTTYEATVENTGTADETFTLSTNIGELSSEQVELDEGEDQEVEVQVNSSGMEDGEHTLTLESQASTFEEPVNSGETTLTVENCWDLDMNIVPEVASAGENMSTIYEIQLKNTGTRDNEYRLVKEGLEWIEIRPEELEIAAGQTATAYMYAGAPFEKKGEVEITAVAEGTEVRESQTVELVIGQEIEDAIRNGNGITGRFMNSATGLYNTVTNADNVQRGLAAVILGLLLTAAILYREW
ncbi:hypothetical protein HRED_05778 [Candidatus Haloredivivus sp. G17]|jgi:uncharacterized membrane protein|nr:hypothetical protein HRED_05778 [Candidatus Haloredivivus sp. G17]MBY6294330.1 hypothetical protein [Nanohaloarchaea archaeon H01]